MKTQENSEMLDKFVNYIMLDGKKSIAKKILNDTFEEIKSKGKKNHNAIFDKSLENNQGVKTVAYNMILSGQIILEQQTVDAEELNKLVIYVYQQLKETTQN